MYLTDDETVRCVVVPGSCTSDYRLRAWRRAGAAAVVLATPVPGGMPTFWAVRRIAHKAWAVFLHYAPPSTWSFFTAEPTGDGDWKLNAYVLGWAGDPAASLRAFPVEADPYPHGWDDLAQILGHDIEP